MAVVVDDVDRAGVYARSPQGRRVQPAATNRHSHTSTRRWCVGGLAVKQDAYDRSRDFHAQSIAVADTLEHLKGLGILPATRKLWVNRKTVTKLKDDPKFQKLMQEDLWTSRNGHRIAYIQDPDGIFFCLYDHPEEPWEGPIPDHY